MSTVDADADAGRGGLQTAVASLNEEKGKRWREYGGGSVCHAWGLHEPVGKNINA